MEDTGNAGAEAAWGIADDCGDARSEWHAARNACVVTATPFRSRIAVTGDDRRTFLQGMLSNDVLKLAAGQGAHAAFLTDTGKVVADLRLYVEAERVILDCLAWCREPLQRGLERYLVADDVELAADGEERALVALEGPGAAATLRAVVGSDVPMPQSPHAHVRLSDGLHIAVASEIGGSGFLISGPIARLDSLLAACRAAGASAIGARALTSLRLEAGVPWARVDMDEGVLIMEMELESALCFTKGCYLGQEVVERVGARGHINRRRTAFLLDGDVAPALPSAIRSGEKEVGRLTSAAHSFLLDRQVGLGLLHIKALAGGAELSVGNGASAISCHSVSLPLEAAAG